MSKNIYHYHHIVPKYMGGTDDHSNIVKLTVEEHAMTHLQLYEKYGDNRDLLAYKGLIGIVGKEEIVRELSSIARGSSWYYNPKDPTQRKMIRENQKVPQGWVKGRGKNTWAANRDYTKVTDEFRKKTSESSKERWSNKPLHGNAHKELEIDGTLYKNTKDAMNKLGVTREAINKWIVKNNGDRYNIKRPTGKNQYTKNRM